MTMLVAIIDSTATPKAKARSCRVLYETDADGRRLTAAVLAERAAALDLFAPAQF